MNLFKKILLSFFPEDLTSQPMNPANMFVSLISSRNFFSRVNRKIVENYKLNMFDVGLDSIDIKMGFGESPINLKEIEKYFSYSIVANLNGYRFFNIASLSNAVCFVSSIYMVDFFRKYNSGYFRDFIITVYLLGFVFFSRLKVFPYEDDKSNYERFLKIFFEFFDIIIKQSGKKLKRQETTAFKNALLKNINVFFMLYYFYKKLNSAFYESFIEDKEFYNWIFEGDFDGGKLSLYKKDFLTNFEKTIYTTTFSNTEKKVLNLIFPFDILIRMVFDEEDICLVVDKFVGEIFSKKELDFYISSFLKNDKYLEDFLVFITDYRNFKNNYFEGIKKLSFSKFGGRNDSSSLEDELEQLKSSVNQSESQDFKIPERLKKESALIEKLMNFYLTFVGGLWEARGDDFFQRIFRKELFDNLLQDLDINSFSKYSIDFMKVLFYSYGKNSAYYKLAFENFKKNKGFVSAKVSFRNFSSNVFVIKLFAQNFVANLLQDFNYKDIKLFINDGEIFDFFRDKFSEDISKLVNFSDYDIICSVYEKVDLLSGEKNLLVLNLYENLTQKQIGNLKNSLYTFDFWIWNSFVNKILYSDIDLSNYYNRIVVYGILGRLRETFFGFMIYIKYLLNYEKVFGRDIYVGTIKDIYISQILNLDKSYINSFKDIIENVFQEYEDIFEKIVELDENKDFFSLGVENRIKFIYNKTPKQVFYSIQGEDIIWFRSFLKNISYYNKRYLFPKE